MSILAAPFKAVCEGQFASWPWSRLAGSFCIAVLLAACGRDEPASADASSGSASAVAVQLVDEAPNGPSPADQRATIDARYALAGDPGVDLRQFRVRVESGVATMESSTADVASRERARELVAAVEGVSDVVIVGAAPAPAQEGSLVAVEVGSDAEAEQGSGFPAADALVELGDPASRLEPPPVAPPSEVADGAEGGSGAVPSAAVPVEPPTPLVADERQYTVQPGDNLSGIAERELGDRGAWRRLYEHNRSVIGSSPERLRDGMVLRLPGVSP